MRMGATTWSAPTLGVHVGDSMCYKSTGPHIAKCIFTKSVLFIVGAVLRIKQRLLQERDPLPSVVVLDYFWLQRGYYTARFVLWECGHNGVTDTIYTYVLYSLDIF